MIKKLVVVAIVVVLLLLAGVSVSAQGMIEYCLADPVCYFFETVDYNAAYCPAENVVSEGVSWDTEMLVLSQLDGTILVCGFSAICFEPTGSDPGAMIQGVMCVAF